MALAALSLGLAWAWLENGRAVAVGHDFAFALAHDAHVSIESEVLVGIGVIGEESARRGFYLVDYFFA